MKKVIKLLVTIAFILGIFYLFFYYESISQYIIDDFIYKKELKPLVLNEYSKRESHSTLKITEDFQTKNINDVINNIYTIVDSGVSEYSFFCDEEYENCIKEVENLANNSALLTLINNYVDPFNSYNKLYISSNTMGKITINIDKLYSQEEIEYINETMNTIKANIITDDMPITEKIKAFHDYIINTTSYDEQKSSEIKDNIYFPNINSSHKATGLYLNHLALCSGYTDTMAIFLNSLNVKNVKVSTEEHIWNAIYLDNKWKHLDLTWDDPVTSDGREMLIYDYFLIDTNSLISKESIQHNFNKNLYIEIATE